MVFCSSCGTNCSDGSAFCHACGFRLAQLSPSANAPGPASPPLTSPPPQHTVPPPPPPSYAYQQPHDRATVAGTATAGPSVAGYSSPPIPIQVNVGPAASAGGGMLIENGRTTPSFDALALALFSSLDRNCYPQNTGGIEASKIEQYRRIGGQAIPPYFQTHVLPTYYDIINAECPSRTIGIPPTLTFNGFRTYALHKILLEPDATMMHFNQVFATFGVAFPLSRSQFPPFPDQVAQAKEANFKGRMWQMAQSAGGGMGMGMGMMGGGAQFGGFGGAKPHKQSSVGSSIGSILKIGANLSGGFNGGSGFGN
ncbi:hypothetical protein T439DRAFT_227833 [Meredithblackwellia eburnea MCA 4105]